MTVTIMASLCFTFTFFVLGAVKSLQTGNRRAPRLGELESAKRDSFYLEANDALGADGTDRVAPP